METIAAIMGLLAGIGFYAVVAVVLYFTVLWRLLRRLKREWARLLFIFLGRPLAALVVTIVVTVGYCAVLDQMEESVEVILGFEGVVGVVMALPLCVACDILVGGIPLFVLELRRRKNEEHESQVNRGSPT